MMNQKQQDADKILLAHIQDMTRKNAWQSFTAFLDMRQYMLVRPFLTEGNYRFFGGYPEAERGILCIHADDAVPEDEDFPITCLTFTFREADTLTHRDMLGSLMAQQIQRNLIGDILVSSGKIQCFVTGAAAAVGMELTKIGHTGVKVTDALPFDADYHQETQEISGTVASPRLDAVLKTALHLRREACTELISRQLVTLNYQETAENSIYLKAGDIFSVRGYGKFRLKSIGMPTKKNRLHIVIEKYL
ncbi:MAG: RNA-binding protein [Oscillospiraceae bacterium]|nr:RNA-binding protein [Oscillospiraceae bacterium]